MVVNYAEKSVQQKLRDEAENEDADDKIEGEVKGNPTAICYKDPKNLKPHPTSAMLYLDALETGHILTPLEACNDIAEQMDVSDLIESISRDGILVPLIIDENGVIVSGSRRWKAAKILGLTSMPVEVKTFTSEFELKLAILNYNRYRVKTFSQLMREAKLYKDIASKLAVKRILAGKRNPMPILAHGTKHLGETNTIVGTKIGMGKETLRKGEIIFHQAEAGDQAAAQIISELDQGTISVNQAFSRLTKKNNNPENGLNSGPRRSEPVHEGHIFTCPQCDKRFRLYHLQNGKHKFLEMGDSETD